MGLYLCEFVCKIRGFIFISVSKPALLAVRGLHYFLPRVPSHVLTEFLRTIFKQTHLSCGCLACARLTVIGKTEEA